jgi:hypothetical protein
MGIHEGVTKMARHWARAPMPREQIVLFSPTLEEAISEDHPVRLLDEILRGVDWSSWVTPRGDHRGRPPIHPRILAGIIFHGLMHRFRFEKTIAEIRIAAHPPGPIDRRAGRLGSVGRVAPAFLR